jgi:glucan phosphorylase
VVIADLHSATPHAVSRSTPLGRRDPTRLFVRRERRRGACARQRDYRPGELAQRDPELRAALDLIAEGRFSRGDRGLFRPLLDSLLARDEFFVLADFKAYAECQERVAAAFADRRRWDRMSLLNTARVGRFSSDRSIRDYARLVWRISLPAAARGAAKG